MKPLRILGLWGPVAAFMLAIFLYSLQTTVTAPPQISDKLLHLAAYGVFGVLCLRATHGGLPRLRPLPTAVALALTVAYGALDEWHQLRLSWRDGSAADWVADAAGAALALGVTALWVRFRRGEESSTNPG